MEVVKCFFLLSIDNPEGPVDFIRTPLPGSPRFPESPLRRIHIDRCIMTHCYETPFTNNAQTYDKEVFTQGAVQGTELIEAEIDFDKSKKIK
jgi:hypothetical protein